jgi:hypothetical protein
MCVRRVWVCVMCVWFPRTGLGVLNEQFLGVREYRVRVGRRFRVVFSIQRFD